MKQLAIVIPAYKIDFFRATLDSLAAQTCKDFTVYVGDDCSPSDFSSLIEEYKNRLDIRYTKFDTNLGGKDLVAQWTRCIELTEGEPWLWLFSDDDVMGERCVELFYKEIENENQYNIYHFDVIVIDSEGSIVNTSTSYPDVCGALDFYKQKASGKIESFVVENVFSREIYNRIGGFVKFDMAWGSDTATWVRMSSARGMKKIEGDFIRWRQSGLNITPTINRDMCIRKLKANVLFFHWGNSFFSKYCINKENSYYFFRRIVYYAKSYSFIDLKNILNYSHKMGVTTKFQNILISIIYPIIKLYKY